MIRECDINRGFKMYVPALMLTLASRTSISFVSSGRHFLLGDRGAGGLRSRRVPATMMEFNVEDIFELKVVMNG